MKGNAVGEAFPERPPTAKLYSPPGKMEKYAATPATRTRKERIEDFAGYTSIVGVQSINRSKSWIRKLFWILAWLVAWGALIWQVYGSFRKYFQYPIEVVVSVQYTPANTPFPAVTICNLNPIRYSMSGFGNGESWTTTANWESNEPTWSTGNESLVSAEPSNAINNFSHSGIEAEEEYGEYEYILNNQSSFRAQFLSDVYDNNDQLESIGHQMKDMLIDCSYQGMQCYHYNFKMFPHGQYGLCYSIRFNQSQYPTDKGPTYGLTLTLLAEQHDYTPEIAPAAGFKVEVHDGMTIPVPEDYGFTTSPGSETSVAVRRSYIERQPFPYNDTDCVSINDRATYKNKSIYLTLERMLNVTTVYSNAACVKSHYIKLLTELCKCVDPEVVARQVMAETDNITRACNRGITKDWECLRKIRVKSSKHSDYDVSNACPNACEENTYQLTITAAKWPTYSFLIAKFNAFIEKSTEAFKKHIRNAIRKEIWYYDDEELHPKVRIARNESALYNVTEEFIYLLPWDIEMTVLDTFREDLVKLNVFFRDLNFESIVETPAMDVLDLLVNLGGTVGLWVGMCMLTFLEVVELLFDLAIHGRTKN